MHDGACWPVRSTQRTIIVLTLQASLKNQSFTQGYTVCCRKRLTLGYDCYALTGLMNAMSRIMPIVLPKNSVENFMDFEHPTCKGRRVQHHTELCAPCRGKLVKTTNAGASPCAIVCRLYGTCQARFFIVHQYIFHAV